MRNNQLLLLFLILIVQQLSAQESEKLTHFGIGITPHIGIIVQKTEGLYESHPQLSIMIDASLIKQLTGRMKFRTGVSLQKAKLSQRDYSPNFPLDHDGMGGVNEKLSYYEIPVEYYSIGIPVSLQIDLSDKPRHFYVSGGARVMQVLQVKEDFLLIESGLITHQLEFEDLNIQMRRTQFYAHASVGYELPFNNGNSISISPHIAYSLLNVFRARSPGFATSLVGGHPLFIGLEMMYKW